MVPTTTGPLLFFCLPPLWVNPQPIPKSMYNLLTFYIVTIYNVYMVKLLQALGITKHRHNWMPTSQATGQGQMGMCVECQFKGRIS